MNIMSSAIRALVSVGDRRRSVMAAVAVGVAWPVQLVQAQAIPPKVLAVDGDQTLPYASQNGLSWATAFRTLQDAIDRARLTNNFTQIWVRGGTEADLYDAPGVPSALHQYPDDGFLQTPNLRSSTFHVPIGLVVYGGFRGDPDGPGGPLTGETTLAERDVDRYRSILSGDLDRNLVSDALNATTVVTSDTVAINDPLAGPWAGLHGVTVEFGYAEAATVGLDPRGGIAAGFYADGKAYAARSTFRWNLAVAGGVTSGGVTAGFGGDPDDAGARFTNCIFLENRATGEAGGPGGAVARGGAVVANEIGSGDAAFVFENCLFVGNDATGTDGGVVSIIGSGGGSFLNCTASGNAADRGGFAYVEADGSGVGASVDLQRSIVHQNVAASGIDAFDEEIRLIFDPLKPATATISNSFVRGIDSVVAYPANNSAADPLFRDALAGDFRLAAASPAIDFAASYTLGDLEDDFDVDDDGVFGELTPDLDLALRSLGMQPDPGAYEYCFLLEYDLDGDRSIGFGDLVVLLAAWGPCSGDCAADLDGNGDVGFSDLLIVIANWGWCQAPTSPPNEIADCIEKLGTSDPQQLAACIEAMMRLEEGD